MRRHFALLWLVLLAPTSALAAQGSFVYGIGGDSCAQFIAAEDGQQLGKHFELERAGITFHSINDVYLAYALGVLSGLNLSRADRRQLELPAEEVVDAGQTAPWT